MKKLEIIKVFDYLRDNGVMGLLGIDINVSSNLHCATSAASSLKPDSRLKN